MLGPGHHVIDGLVAMGAYDEPAVARALGWDAEAVVRSRTGVAALGGPAVSATMLDADACVVGAGAGGAVVAAELAEAGANVVVLEQGPEHDANGFTARPPQMLARLYREGSNRRHSACPRSGCRSATASAARR